MVWGKCWKLLESWTKPSIQRLLVSCWGNPSIKHEQIWAWRMWRLCAESTEVSETAPPVTENITSTWSSQISGFFKKSERHVSYIKFFLYQAFPLVSQISDRRPCSFPWVLEAFVFIFSLVFCFLILSFRVSFQNQRISLATESALLDLACSVAGNYFI